jgi:hypothetical protein
MRSVYVPIALLVIAAAAAYLAVPKEVHEHANFLVYINGQQMNFSQEKFLLKDIRP